MRRFKIILSLALAALMLATCARSAPTGAEETTTVRRGDLTVTVSSSGTVQPARQANLTFGATGTVEQVFVDEGQVVKQGQQLGALDIRDLDQQVAQAEANLQTARARLEQAQSGNATEQDIAAQQANVAAAQAQATKARTGNVTAADIANAQAAVRSAQAGLERARTGNVTAADIANAQAAVRSAEAQYQKATSGPLPDQVSAAQARLTQAEQSLVKIAASASANKTSAEQSVLQAADTVRISQTAYSSAYWDNQQAQNGIDPRSGHTFDALKLDAAIEQQKYADALRNAELQLSQAQSRMEQAKVAADNARQQEVNDVASAQAQVDDARVQLDELLKGPTSADVAVAQAQLDQARAQLQKLKAGGSAPDVAAAQAQLDQARAQLQKLRQGGTTADIAGARAQVDQANAQLQKLRQGGTAADVAAAQAQVNAANAQLEKLTAGAAPSDISIAEAGVAEAEAQLTAAQLSRDKAILRAPFDGIITAVNVVIGDSSTPAGATEAAFTQVDASELHLEVNISESDVAQIEEGQTAEITIDALGNEVISGTVDYIAPAATVLQNVTTYLVRVALPADNNAIRVGMNASIDIGTAEQQNVLIIPTSAFRSEGNRRFVRLKQGTQFTDREVQLGLSNDIEAEVISGLAEGDVIAALGTAPDGTN